MSRLTISLSDNLHNRISSLAAQYDDSMSSIINQLIHIGMQHWNERQQGPNLIEQHCQQLIIQMNALIKNMSVELLKFTQDDFEQLQKAAMGKFTELKEG
ncbi:MULTISPECIES: hypothetical protein [Legionellaceae]|uniref:Uncharacterized protein n=1 Tax=Legionella bozemanae TaxID=447 RepID=A0A0W0R9G1_LEGBO|nr:MULTISPECIES: hypothetical protein [Legionellaceae]KTC67716.1 hypothetical protein Lboz_3530 [Legionella bozemanae]MCW8497065.1 hypothetical protein [Fluoribacter dumoffii]STO32905.1 Uncharacterised protein [Legionella bozemanae]